MKLGSFYLLLLFGGLCISHSMMGMFLTDSKKREIENSICYCSLDDLRLKNQQLLNEYKKQINPTTSRIFLAGLGMLGCGSSAQVFPFDACTYDEWGWLMPSATLGFSIIASVWLGCKHKKVCELEYTLAQIMIKKSEFFNEGEEV